MTLQRKMPPDIAARMARQDAHSYREDERVGAVLRGGAPEIVVAEVSLPKRPARDMTKEERRSFQKETKEAIKANQQAQFNAIVEANAEAAAEKAAPSVRRRAITDAAGNVIRAPHIERDGVTFVVSNPVKHLVARGAMRVEKGQAPLITDRHLAASDRLVTAWNEGGKGIGIGASDYERMGLGGGTGGGGGYSDQLLEMMRHQRKQRAIYEGAMAWLGGLGGVVRRVVIQGADLTVWASETPGQTRFTAPGYLAAALDRLGEFFKALDGRRKPANQIRVAQFTHPPQDAVNCS